MSIQAIPIISTQGMDMIIISTMAMTMDLAVTKTAVILAQVDIRAVVILAPVVIDMADTRTVVILAPVDIRAVVILAPVVIDMADTRTVVMDSTGIRIGAIIKSLNSTQLGRVSVQQILPKMTNDRKLGYEILHDPVCADK
jgi:hypothetical protein